MVLTVLQLYSDSFTWNFRGVSALRWRSELRVALIITDILLPCLTQLVLRLCPINLQTEFVLFPSTKGTAVVPLIIMLLTLSDLVHWLWNFQLCGVTPGCSVSGCEGWVFWKRACVGEKKKRNGGWKGSFYPPEPLTPWPAKAEVWLLAAYTSSRRTARWRPMPWRFMCLVLWDHFHLTLSNVIFIGIIL